MRKSGRIIAMRNPVVAAKQLATIDNLSSGRLMVALGAGWNEKEFSTLGASFHDRGRLCPAASPHSIPALITDFGADEIAALTSGDHPRYVLAGLEAPGCFLNFSSSASRSSFVMFSSSILSSFGWASR